MSGALLRGTDFLLCFVTCLLYLIVTLLLELRLRLSERLIMILLDPLASLTYLVRKLLLGVTQLLR